MATPTSCPICHAPWKPGATVICASCGADLSDPDVQAMAGMTAHSPGASQSMPGIASGSLSVGGFLGLRKETLADGSALRRHAIFGGVPLLLAFALPAVRAAHFEFKDIDPISHEPQYQRIVEFTASWHLVHGAGMLKLVALFFPVFAGLGALGLAFAPRVTAELRAQGLAALGLLGLVFCVGGLGEYGGAPTNPSYVATLGLLVAGVGITVRMLVPQGNAARYAMIAGAGIFLIGLLIPAGDMTTRLPLEFQFRQSQMHINFADAMPLKAIAGGLQKIHWDEVDGFDVRQRSGFVVEMLFLALWLLLPLVALPAAAALGWRRVQGVWDRTGHALRPLAWLVVLYLPLTYALYTFNAMGWSDERAHNFMYGRVRLLAMITPFALWAQFGVAALFTDRVARAVAAAPEPVVRRDAAA